MPAWTSPTTASGSRSAEIAEAAKSGVHCVGLSILSGSAYRTTPEEVLTLLRGQPCREHVPLIVGGIVPPGPTWSDRRPPASRGGLHGEG